ncbi:hypothetical protein K450DRAFT_269940 [Umbelopsis ramanniana AG]|uniref:PHD-type domain-containing protein n=1 Tax=Umbelopsis ramanniana AG TaxID=1314678 RepID=A0AAD5HH44_UMBRA|nr:uncharacterized protein K450DRAFT_269940 [Umbelopsis ramanniana AG]KAI8581793.1 hypothetical protein K450DRAFT_269940 [Umbelopsis ramanniana AG]
MAESLCFALLRTTTLQILQSAGFESSHLTSADVLTDVFSRYLELLGQTTAELAEHSGRVKANALDTSTTFSELHIDIGSLRDWLEIGDGKVLLPSWSNGNDPGQVLNGISSMTKRDFTAEVRSLLMYSSIDVIRSGCQIVDPDDTIEYEYQEVPEDIDTLLSDDDAFTESSEEEFEEDDVDETNAAELHNGVEYGNHQSNYIPNHLPPLPIQSLDDDNVSAPQVEQPSSSTAQKQDSQAPKPLNAILLKTGKRKAPKEPYRHKIPFEDSYLGNLDIRGAEDSTMQDIQASSLEDNHKMVPFDKLSKYVEKKKDAGVQATKRHKSWANSEHFAENINPNRMLMFSDELVSTAPPSILEKIITKVAPSAAVSKLSAPNLWTDVIASGSSLPEDAISKPTVDVPEIPTPVIEKPAPAPVVVKRAKSNSISSAGTTVVHPPKKHEPVRTAAPTSLAALAASDSTPAAPKKSGLTVNLSLNTLGTHNQPAPSSAAAPSSSDSSTPKIRFKLKLPTVVESAPPPVEVSGGDTEVINCICDNPHVDYGTFMIACDNCSEWFHGDCVGIRESDQVAEWYCMRCRPRH